jgi:hypothetical protein
MTAGEFFGRFARLMKDNPPAAAAAPTVAKLKSLGIEPGKDFDIARADPRIARALNRAMGAFELLESGVQKLETKDGWIVIPENFADYGTDYLTRAGIAMIGLGGIERPDVVYPTAFLDGSGKPLDAAHRYVLHFEKDELPPGAGHLVGRPLRPGRLLRAERAQPLRALGVDAAPVQRRRLTRPPHPVDLARRGQASQLAARSRERAVQPHRAHLLAGGRCARRQLQPPAAEEGAMSLRSTESSGLTSRDRRLQR